MKTHTRVLFAILLAFLSMLSYAQAPVPFINQPLIPDATPPGGAQFTLTVNGTGFVSSSVVNWNGNALATQFVRSSQLTATVPAADIAKASTASVAVVNPAPGGGTSNVVFFTVTANTGGSVGFTLAWNQATAWPTSVAVGDFNGDGKLDLAISNGLDFGVDYMTVSIFLGDGTGNFTLASSPATGARPQSVVVGDFNGDGKLDLAVANFGSNTLSILLGDGTGNFTPASSPVAGGTSPNAVAVGDFNGDGKLDLATANPFGNTVSILLGDGTGNFTLASSPTVGAGPESVAVGDFNGDGKLDLAVANINDDTVSILLGDGTGNFTLASSPATGGLSVAVAVGDFNGDGKLDLAVVNWSGTVSILLGDGAGNFTLAPSIGLFEPCSVAVGDFNGDGKLDIAAASHLNAAFIFLGVPLAPAVTLSPASLTFATQLIGTSSSPQTVTLTNIGGAPLDIAKGVINANFSQTNNCPRQLPPGGTCTANVVFTPRNVNNITGTITITDNAPNSPQTIPLSGVGFAVTLLPSSLDFGDQSVGTTSQPQTITLTNYAPKAVTIFGGEFTGSNPNQFGLQNTTCQNSLPGGGSCTINIVFAPKGKGPKAATLEVRDNGGLSPQTVSLTGTGTQ